MRPFCLVQSQRVRQRVEDAVGGAAEVSAFQAVVVVDAEPGERRDLLAAQPGHPTRPEDLEPDVSRSDPRAPGREEVADLAPRVHIAQG
jgi:hypothetical protein